MDNPKLKKESKILQQLNTRLMDMNPFNPFVLYKRIHLYNHNLSKKTIFKIL